MVISIDLFLQQYFFKFPVLRYVTCLVTLKKKNVSGCDMAF